jgi:hypothetical protein
MVGNRTDLGADDEPDDARYSGMPARRCCWGKGGGSGMGGAAR